MTLSTYAELRRADAATAGLITRSAATTEGVLTAAELDVWLAERHELDTLSIERIPFTAPLRPDSPLRITRLGVVTAMFPLHGGNSSAYIPTRGNRRPANRNSTVDTTAKTRARR